MGVAQHQTVQLILHVSGWQSSSGVFFPLKQSLKHFKLYERNSAPRSFEGKLFGRTNAGEWVTPSTRLLNTVAAVYAWFLSAHACTHADAKFQLTLPNSSLLFVCEESKPRRFIVFLTPDTHLMWVHLALFSVVQEFSICAGLAQKSPNNWPDGGWQITNRRWKP